ncbi:hypothetical protein GCM10025867_06220 [Frondihabitans sucicola]|uniref:DMT family transporter n=1 Tax=Frondihabitans sucicola TaxID=1268041 RepID=A0ABN6XU94_9MICO|nr:DMT family transporter [Frondihabitans sucicola]BDZ48381.1 hypothetical protein GCM10025867_06220 [Frondihabitans sucicola]
MNTPHRAGPLAIVAASTLWQAVGTVVIARVITAGTAPLSSFLAFAAAAVICVVQAFLRGALPGLNRHVRCRSTLLVLVGMNAATAGVFVAFFSALVYLPPTSVSVLEAGSAPLIVTIAVASRSRRRLRLRTVAAPVCVVIVSVGIAARSILVDGTRGAETWLGLALAVFAGFSGAFVVLFSVELSKAGLTAVQVNASRFHLAWIVSGLVFLLGTRGGSLVSPDIPRLVFVSVLLGAAPLIVLQYGLGRANPVSSELVLSSLPALVFLTEVLLARRFDPLTAALMVVLLAVSACSLVAQLRVAQVRAAEWRAALMRVATKSAAVMRAPVTRLVTCASAGGKPQGQAPRSDPATAKAAPPPRREMIHVLVIDPESSGTDLVRELRERNVHVTTWWQDVPFVLPSSDSPSRRRPSCFASSTRTSSTSSSPAAKAGCRPQSGSPPALGCRRPTRSSSITVETRTA